MSTIQLKQMSRLATILGFVVLALVALSFHGKHASAASDGLPPGLVSGAQFQILINFGTGIYPETLEVIETDGTWVHAKVVRSQVWSLGDVWVNLAATDFGYVKVIGVAKPAD